MASGIIKSKYPVRDSLETRIHSGAITSQRYSDMVRELNSQSEERLNAVALTDCVREFTYRQMFRQWDKYAETFSALGISGENGSRVGVASLPFIETIFAMYALNMTGASVSLLIETATLEYKELKKTIRGEGITDLVLVDAAIKPDVYMQLRRGKQRLGLRSIIMLSVDTDSLFYLPRLQSLCRLSQAFIRMQPDVTYMDGLIRRYEASELHGAKDTSDAAIILHTSGTAGGMRKPVPFSNMAFNEGAARFLRIPEYREMFEGTAVSLSGLPLCSCYGAIDQYHLPFLFGGKIVTAPFSILSPRCFELMGDYGANIAFFGGIETEIAENASTKADLSALKLAALGGTYVSPEKKAKFDQMLKSFGFGAGASLGYGLSEAGGACFLGEAGSTEDTLGRALPGVKVKIFSEEDKKYYDAGGGARDGVLMISSPSISTGRIDGRVFFEHEIIDGEPYINTYDLVHADENGVLSYVGRANRFFIDNTGGRYDAGLVERAVASQPGINDCGIVAVYSKKKHDTVPVLYVSTDKHGTEAKKTAENALYNVFVKESSVEDKNLPYQIVVVDYLPHTPAGKVDTRRILKNPLIGIRLDPEAVRKSGKLIDLRFTPGTPVESDIMGGGRIAPGMPDLADIFEPDIFVRKTDGPGGHRRPRGKKPVPPPPAYRYGREGRPWMPFPPPLPYLRTPPFDGRRADRGVTDCLEEREDRGFCHGCPICLSGQRPFGMFVPEETAVRTSFDWPSVFRSRCSGSGSCYEHGAGRNDPRGEGIRRRSDEDVFGGRFGDLLRLLFRASDYDGFYED